MLTAKRLHIILDHICPDRNPEHLRTLGLTPAVMRKLEDYGKVRAHVHIIKALVDQHKINPLYIFNLSNKKFLSHKKFTS